MHSLIRYAASLGFAGVLFGAGVASGAAGSAMLLGRTNDAGVKGTTIRTTSVGAALRAQQLGSGPALVAQAAESGVALELRSGAFRVAGAGVKTKTAAFIQPDNPADRCDTMQLALDHPMLNGNPDALVFLTPRDQPAQGAQTWLMYIDENGPGPCPSHRWYIRSTSYTAYNVFVIVP